MPQRAHVVLKITSTCKPLHYTKFPSNVVLKGNAKKFLSQPRPIKGFLTGTLFSLLGFELLWLSSGVAWRVLKVYFYTGQHKRRWPLRCQSGYKGRRFKRHLFFIAVERRKWTISSLTSSRSEFFFMLDLFIKFFFLNAFSFMRPRQDLGS